MSDERQAKLVIERWVAVNIVPKIVQMLSATDYVRDEPVVGTLGTVRLHRTITGRVCVTCNKDSIVEALMSLLGERYLVQRTYKSAKSHIVYVTPKSATD